MTYYALANIYLSPYINDTTIYVAVPIIVVLLLIVVIHSLRSEARHHTKLFNAFCLVLGIFHYFVFIRKYFNLSLDSLLYKYKEIDSFPLSLIWEIAFLCSLVVIGVTNLIKDILQGKINFNEYIMTFYFSIPQYKFL